MITAMTPKILRIATRKSPLALWQAQHIAKLIKGHWPKITIELLPMVTSGDKFLKDKLLALGGKGLFVKELEEALLDKRADLAVHSMKDIPASFPEGLGLAAICQRDSPFDALVSKDHKNLKDLPAGSIIGTTSLRRQAQLLALRPDLKIKALRGNINTRLAKLAADEYDAIILAASGLERLAMQTSISEILAEELMLPACGQGALGIECRMDDLATQELLAPLNHSLSALCVNAERYVNALLGGNCHAPLAVFCKAIDDKNLLLSARVLKADGSALIEDSRQGPQIEAHAIAEACAQALLSKGADKLLAQNND